MERLTPMAGSTDRDQREQLEQVQMELRMARLTLQTASDERARAERALRESILEATVRRDQLVARLAALKSEGRDLVHRLEELAPRVEAKRAEDELLARGAVLRDRYVDWNPEDSRNRVGDGLTARQVRIWAIAIAGLLIIAGSLWLHSKLTLR